MEITVYSMGTDDGRTDGNCTSEKYKLKTPSMTGVIINKQKQNEKYSHNHTKTTWKLNYKREKYRFKQK